LVLDWNWDEDRRPIRKRHRPENLAALCRFAIGVIKSKTQDSVSDTIQRLARIVRLDFDCLHMPRILAPIALIYSYRPGSAILPWFAGSRVGLQPAPHALGRGLNHRHRNIRRDPDA
jgi:hypothetical protein